jgi:hypothetical protein
VAISLNGAGKEPLDRSSPLKLLLTVTQAGGSTPLLTRGVSFTSKD